MIHTQLCQLAGDWRGVMPADGWMVEEKIDGFRCLYFTGIDGKARLWTRNGIPIEGCDHILYRLSLMEKAAGEPMFFDGELQVDFSLAATKAWVETGWKYGGEAGTYHAFDCLPFREWQTRSDRPLWSRKAMLRDLWQTVEDSPDLTWEWRPGSRGRDEGATPVVLIEDGWAATAADAIDAANRIWVRRGEGVMLKDPMAPYQRKRTSAWLKVKQANQHYWRKAA